MSTERSSEPGESPRRADHRPHGRLVAAVIAVLAVTAASLGAGTQLQGPRLEGVDVNAAAVTDRAGQTVTLQVNQPLDDDEELDVSVSPETPVEADVEGNTVTVTFSEALKYATDYTVSVTARGLHTGVTGDLDAAFTTVDPEAVTLVRGEGDDRLEAQSLVDGGRHEVIATSDRIQEYRLLDDQTIVIALDDQDRPAVRSVSRSGGETVTMLDSGLAAARDLRVEPRTRLAGFIVDDLDPEETFAVLSYTDSLVLYDMNNPKTMLATVVDENNRPLEIAEWRFIPGSTGVIARTLDGDIVEYDPALGEAAVPSTEAAWADAAAADGTSADEAADAEAGSDVGAADETAGAGDGSTLELEIADNAVRVRDGSGERELFRPAAESSRLGETCFSPNGEYVAVQVFSGDGEPDGYPEVPGFSGASVSYVRVADGLVVRSMNGMLPDWCRR